MSDRIAIMNNGRIVQHGTPRDIYRRPNSVFVSISSVPPTCCTEPSLRSRPIRVVLQTESGAFFAPKTETPLREGQRAALSLASRGHPAAAVAEIRRRRDRASAESSAKSSTRATASASERVSNPAPSSGRRLATRRSRAPRREDRVTLAWAGKCRDHIEGGSGMNSEPKKAELLIRHGYVITMDDAATIYEHGAVAIDAEGRILAIGDDADISALLTAAGANDRCEGRPGASRLRRMPPFLLRSISTGARCPTIWSKATPSTLRGGHFYSNVAGQDEYLSVLLACMEMVRNGTTCFMEAGTVLTPEMAARAANEVGVRAVIGDALHLGPACRGLRRARPTDHREGLRDLRLLQASPY